MVKGRLYFPINCEDKIFSIGLVKVKILFLPKSEKREKLSGSAEKSKVTRAI